MTTPSAIEKMIAWQGEHLSSLVYSETGDRLSNTLTVATDCSGLCRRLYWVFAGLDIGTFTGNEDDHGWLITSSKSVALTPGLLLPGDLVFYRWENRSLGSDPFDHVNFFAGGDLVYNHGGPGRGPVKQSLKSNVVDAVAVMVRRYIAPVTPPVVKPTPKPTPPTPAPVQEEITMLVRFHDAPKGASAVFGTNFETLTPLTLADYDGIGRPTVHVLSCKDSNLYKLPVTPGLVDPRK